MDMYVDNPHLLSGAVASGGSEGWVWTRGRREGSMEAEVRA